MGCAALETPLWGLFLALEIHHFKPFSSSRDSPFQALFQHQRPHFCFGGKSAFLSPIFSNFGLICSSSNTNFSKNLFPRPQFQAKKSVLETLLLKNLGGTYLPKKKFKCPPWDSAFYSVRHIVSKIPTLILPLTCISLKHLPVTLACCANKR